MDEPQDEPSVGLKEFLLTRFVDTFPIGEGRNASVHRAWDTHLQRQVAFKKSEETDDELLGELDSAAFEALGLGDDAIRTIEHMQLENEIGRRYTLLREGQLLAQVDHPNVIPVLDIGVLEDGTVAVVLPYLEAGTLDHQVLPESWEDVLDIVLQIGRGLAAIHAAELLHRDLKPNNILFGSDGRPRIADLGLACRIDDAVFMADWVGTANYMAPEVIDHRLRDVRDDLYALCLIAYEMFYARSPFSDWEARKRGQVRASIRDGGMPRALDRILVRGLAADPDQRWADVPTMLQAMERVRPRARRRWPWMAAAAGFAAAVSVGVLMSARPAHADACEEVMGELEPIWDREIQAELRGAFGTRKAGDGLQRWANRWVDVRAQECNTAKRDDRETEASPCSASMRERFDATLHAFRTPHLRRGLNAATVIAELPAPEHCIDHPEDGTWGDGGLLELAYIDVEVGALVGLDDLEVARTRQLDYMELALELRSEYGITRAMFWRGEIRRLGGELDGATRDFERVYERAQDLGVPVVGAEAMMKLTAIAGVRGELRLADGYALAARGVFAAQQPERVAELLQTHGLALLSGSEPTRARGVELLQRAVELREDQFEEHGGTQELLSQAHENYARGLLAVHRAYEAVEYLELALRVHEEEFGHGTWRNRGILLQKFAALVELRRMNATESVWREILRYDTEAEDWDRYIDDAYWLADVYRRAGQPIRAALPLRAGRQRAVQHERNDEVARFDGALSELMPE